MEGLRRFSKLTCFSTLFLIFVGGMVTSTGSGLAVPDWPLSYGMLFPPMVGGIFYEHSHRMAAATVGLLTVGLVVGLGIREKRRWVRLLGIWALAAVVAQGLLGGLTVLFLLPKPISISHGILAQTFFVLTIIIAYSLSAEREIREFGEEGRRDPRFIKMALLFTIIVYVQLILGAIMRHTGSGLAIPDFPKMGGYWIPPFHEGMLSRINDWRFGHNLDPVRMGQVVTHFIHRVGALGIAVVLCFLNTFGFKYGIFNKKIFKTLLLLDSLVIVQLALGALTVLTYKSSLITSFHVVTGAAVLGVCVLLFLRTAPLSMNSLKQELRLR
ncbi:MAG: hypothetical protein A3D87_00670 [Omnitrophica WOR_2 bacterium RIFCSPHIGHO2_02_FULL_50_17]|nr:MAG: hypothetical protein A3D87_00670 [Omnitrophica WOR_2 bacterium RIFCSPHIGHO2_02_FULL_50_17]